MYHLRSLLSGVILLIIFRETYCNFRTRKWLRNPLEMDRLGFESLFGYQTCQCRLYYISYSRILFILEDFMILQEYIYLGYINHTNHLLLPVISTGGAGELSFNQRVIVQRVTPSTIYGAQPGGYFNA